MPSDVVYRIDESDNLSFVNHAWDRFARENDGGHLVSPVILRRPLWDYVSDSATRQLYVSILQAVREGASIQFPIRCDSPEERRLLEMRLTPLGRGDVEFRSRVVSLERRSRIMLLDVHAPRSSDTERICSWCKRLKVGDRWLDVAEAVLALDLFDRERMPSLSHGICPICYEEMIRKIDLI